MAKHILRQIIESSAGVPLTEKQNTYSGTSVGGVDGETAAGSGTTEFVVAIDVSAVKSFFVVCSVDAILETNSSSAADDTISLVAGVPYVWNTDSYDAFLLGTDVTSIFFTVAGATAGVVYLGYVADATP